MFNLRLAFIVTALLLGAGGCTPDRPTQTPIAADPEAATGVATKVGATSERYMVAAATPAATEAGLAVLKRGGSAVDAAVAVQAMLTLTEPQSSGIGGGAFMLYWDNQAQQLFSLDAREMAPQTATPELFYDEAGHLPESFWDAVIGGRSVGVPGVVRGLELAHDKWGKLAWSSLFTDTINSANSGFVVGDRLAKLLALEINPGLRESPTAGDYFYPNGEPLQAGTIQYNPALADTLTAIAEQGADAFYQGSIAAEIVAAVQSDPRAQGLLTEADLAAYNAQLREPVCAAYRSQKVCGMGPPSSGGITVLQILGILAQFDVAAMPPHSAEAIHHFTQASRLAFADRNRYIADSDFVDVPVTRMLESTYLAERAELIQPTDMGKAAAGSFANFVRADDQSPEYPNTSHFSIIDAQGNAVSMTTSIEMGFGSSVMAAGFLLNNQLTDFSIQPRDGERWIANRVEAGKRPRSSMSPTMIFDESGARLVHVLGSPGGSRIINYVAQTIVGIIDWQLDMQAAIDLPKYTNTNGVTTLEAQTTLEDVAEQLRERGHELRIRDLNSGLHGITVLPDGRLFGGADPRREGIAKGD